MSKIKRDGATVTTPAPLGSSANMEAVHIDLGATAGTDVPSRVEASPRFMLAAHPERWAILCGRLVPLCGKIKCVPGLENCEYFPPRVAGEKGRWSLRQTILSWEQRGWQVIPLDVDGAGTSYLVSPRGRPDVCLTRFDRVFSGSTHAETDLDGYSKWLYSIVERGVVRRAPAYVIDAMIAERQQRRGELADRVHATPSLGVELKRVDAELETLRVERAKLPMFQSDAEAVTSLE